MTHSMTGYGKAEVVLNSGKLVIEIKSLNGKNADISIKTYLLPKDKELIVRQLLSSSLNRGNIDLFINFEANAVDSAKRINSDLVLEYFEQINNIAGKITSPNISDDKLDPSNIMATVLRFPDVLESKKTEIINEDNWDVILDCIKSAIKDLQAFRQKEGQILKADLSKRVANILKSSQMIETFESERVQTVKERILSRFAELKLEVDQSRLEQELIFYIEKVDIHEEKIRLRQHCQYFIDTLENDPQPGKKLGFIAQEMGREINTTGSKANHIEIQKLVVLMKDELEKIKEQSLNVL